MLESQRKNLINKLMSIIEDNHDYAVIHHLKLIFDRNTDIDLVIGCNKRELISLAKKISVRLNLNIINFFTIDRSIYRLDFVFFGDDNRLETIELDCLTIDEPGNLCNLDARELLKKRRLNYIDGFGIYSTSPKDEYEYYIKKKAFKKSNISTHYEYLRELLPGKSTSDIDKQYNKCLNYFSRKGYKVKFLCNKLGLFFKRINEHPSNSIAILGPDGSGKSTIINKLFDSHVFNNNYYFHLKPLKNKSTTSIVCSEPHEYPPYGPIKSYIKLLYFVIQYSLGWVKNIAPLSIQPSIIVFDRYYDDILSDPRRYRFGGSLSIVKLIRNIIPKPDLYFILTTDASIIQNRKKEVAFEELERQISVYSSLVDNVKYFHVDASLSPDEIVNHMIKIISCKNHAKL